MDVTKPPRKAAKARGLSHNLCTIHCEKMFANPEIF